MTAVRISSTPADFGGALSLRFRKPQISMALYAAATSGACGLEISLCIRKPVTKAGKEQSLGC